MPLSLPLLVIGLPSCEPPEFPQLASSYLKRRKLCPRRPAWVEYLEAPVWPRTPLPLTPPVPAGAEVTARVASAAVPAATATVTRGYAAVADVDTTVLALRYGRSQLGTPGGPFMPSAPLGSAAAAEAADGAITAVRLPPEGTGRVAGLAAIAGVSARSRRRRPDRRRRCRRCRCLGSGSGLPGPDANRFGLRNRAYLGAGRQCVDDRIRGAPG